MSDGLTGVKRLGDLPAGWRRDENGALRREAIPSMLRRLEGWDYRQRAIYQITITLAERSSMALGHVEARRRGEGEWLALSSARGRGWRPDEIEARFAANELGLAVEACWLAIPAQWPGVSLLSHQLMPDHFHGLLFVERPQKKTLGNIIGSFKSKSASRVKQILAARGQEPDGRPRLGLGGGPVDGPGDGPRLRLGDGPRLGLGGGPGDGLGGGPRLGLGGGPVDGLGGGASGASPRAAGLWSPGYQDTILFREGQLANMRRYLADNPRRLAIKRLFPALFKVAGGLSVALPVGKGLFCALGNRFLLERPLAQVQVSRRDFGYERQPKPGGGVKIARDGDEPRVAFATPAYRQKRDLLIKAAQHGAVLISPCVSDGERQIAREALAAGLPLITLHNKGFSPLQKPSGRYFAACAEGRLLMLAPAAWPYQPGEKPMTRTDATALNRLTQWLAGDNAAEINYHGLSPANIDALAKDAVCLAP